MSDLNPLHPAEAAESSIFWFYDNLIYKIKNEEKENLSMAKEKKFVQAITSRDEDFAQWYTDVVREAKLCDYSSVKGYGRYTCHSISR